MNAVEVITIIQPDALNWYPMLLLLIPLIVGPIISFAVDGEDGGAFALVGILGSLIAFFVWGMSLTFSYEDAWNDARASALEEIGYSQVEVNERDFDAVKDGERVVGILRDVPNTNNLQYQVVVIPPVEGK